MRRTFNGKRFASLRKSYSDYLKCEGVGCMRYNLCNENLNGINLSCLDLREADFTGASLVGTNMKYSDLQRAILIGVDISNAKFLGANVDGLQPESTRQMIQLRQVMEHAKNGIQGSIFD